MLAGKIVLPGSQRIHLETLERIARSPPLQRRVSTVQPKKRPRSRSLSGRTYGRGPGSLSCFEKWASRTSQNKTGSPAPAMCFGLTKVRCAVSGAASSKSPLHKKESAPAYRNGREGRLRAGRLALRSSRSPLPGARQPARSRPQRETVPDATRCRRPDIC